MAFPSTILFASDETATILKAELFSRSGSKLATSA